MMHGQTQIKFIKFW